MADDDLVRAVLLQEAQESQTIFGGGDEMLEVLVQSLEGQLSESTSKFEHLRALATLHGFELRTRSQLNAAALHCFLGFGEPAMAVLAAEIMQDCGVHTQLEVGELEFEREDHSNGDFRVYAFSERKLLAKAFADAEFGLVLRWHKEAYYQHWHGQLDVTMHPRKSVVAGFTVRDDGPGYAWNTHVGWGSHPHWPRVELMSTGKEVLRLLNIWDPELELPEKPPILK